MDVCEPETIWPVLVDGQNLSEDEFGPDLRSDPFPHQALDVWRFIQGDVERIQRCYIPTVLFNA